MKQRHYTSTPHPLHNTDTTLHTPVRARLLPGRCSHFLHLTRTAPTNMHYRMPSRLGLAFGVDGLHAGLPLWDLPDTIADGA